MTRLEREWEKMKILVCLHEPHVGLGFFESLLPKLGISIDFQKLYLDPKPRFIEEYQGLMVMGGTMNANQIGEYPFLQTGYQYIERALEKGIPMLGFCLGELKCWPGHWNIEFMKITGLNSVGMN